MLTAEVQQQGAQLLDTFQVLLLGDIQNRRHAKHITAVIITILVVVTILCIHVTLLNTK
jgi:hypothetical protein